MKYNGWYPVTRFKDLERGPKRVVIDDTPLVVWQLNTREAATLVDFCPHRGAPLSAGKPHGTSIACPYHGWRFNSEGRCVEMPALAGEPVVARAKPYPTKVLNGVVHVALGNCSTLPENTPLMEAPYRERLVTDIMPATLAELAENILDTTHTSIVHAGYLRSSSISRAVSPKIRSGPDWIEAHYPAEASPSGLISRLIGSGRYQITDRFRAPAIAEVDYRKDGKLEFRLQTRLTPQDHHSTLVFAWIAIRGKNMTAALKTWAAHKMLTRVVEEDRAILKKVTENRKAHKFNGSPFIAPQDLMRKGIDAILRGDAPQPNSNAPQLMV